VFGDADAVGDELRRRFCVHSWQPNRRCAG
jgi:hypothetical protein